jgi:hypothetical protein
MVLMLGKYAAQQAHVQSFPRRKWFRGNAETKGKKAIYRRFMNEASRDSWR